MFRKSRIPIVILISSALALRFFHLAHNDLWYDEILTLLLAKKAPFIWNPPLYYLFIKIWAKISGISELSLRFPSAIFSLASVLLTYKMAKEMFSQKTALTSTAIMSFSAFQIWYAQEARPYALVLFLSLLSTYFLWQGYKTKRRKYKFFYIVCITLGIYSHYIGLAFLASHLLYLILKKKYKLAGTFFLIEFLAFFPWIRMFFDKLHRVQQGFWIMRPRLDSLAITFSNFLLGYNGSHNLYIASFVILSFILYHLLRDFFIRKEVKEEILFCAVLGIIPIVAVFVFSQIYFSIYLDRIFIIFSPHFYMIVAFYLQKQKKYAGMFLSTILISAIVLTDMNYYQNKLCCPTKMEYHIGVHTKKPFKPLAKFLRQRINPHTAILIGNKSIMPSLIYYLFRKKIERDFLKNNVLFTYNKNLIDENHRMPYKDVPFIKKRRQVIEKNEIIPLIERKKIKKVFFLGCNWPRSGLLDINSYLIKKFLNNNYKLILQREFSGIKVFLYEARH